MDTSSFDERYYNVHTPLVRKLPGLRKPEVSRITGAPIGEPKYHLVAEMHFDNREALDSVMASNEGRTSARDLMSFAADPVTLSYAEVQT